ncbi:hypothetical protein [Rhodoferax sp.]|uniref:hypothetical protein n=1 Tax=Rhodoferax sp. TaxID=50421 RepID=UPI00374DEFBA
MSQQATSAVSQPRLIETLLSRTGAPNAPAMTEELLPFTVILVRDEDDLNKAVQIRHSAYARHLPDFAETLKDVYPGIGYIPFSHVGGLPHRVMSLEVDSVEPSWAAAKQPFYEFFFHTHLPNHPILPRSRWTSAVHLHFPQTLAANQGPRHLRIFPECDRPKAGVSYRRAASYLSPHSCSQLLNLQATHPTANSCTSQRLPEK